MGKVITMFMWGYQGSFRIHLEGKAKRVLEDIAPTLDPDALLIGVRVPERSDILPVCVEPEDGEWETGPFLECFNRAAEIYKTHEEHKILYGDEARTRDQPENIRKSSVKQAVQEVLDRYDSAHGTKTFCSWPERLGGYHVVCALQFNKAHLHEYPSLSEPIEHPPYKISGGFLDLVIEELLDEARRALWGPDPGRFFGTFNLEKEAIFRRAGDTFCSVLTLAAKDFLFQGTLDKFDKIAAQLYERREGLGRLLVAASEHRAVRFEIEFASAVPLEHARWARKILEMAGGDLFCVCNGANGIRALGTMNAPDADGIFLLEFTGHARWQLKHRGKVLLESESGVPRLPREQIKESTFKSTFRRVFKDVTPENEDRCWQLVLAATRQRHGTMLVFSVDAESEAKRLRKDGTCVTPVSLSPALIERVSSIDGAVLVDHRGTCWALGVILDGTASTEGNPARGARFNSAIRYVSSRSHDPVLVLVVSEDGSVDLIPHLRPQIARSAIDRRIKRLAKCTIENYHKPRNWLVDHAFYLTPEQCRLVNDEIARIENVPREPMRIHVDTRVFEPHPEMDPSYYLPEP